MKEGVYLDMAGNLYLLNRVRNITHKGSYRLWYNGTWHEYILFDNLPWSDVFPFVRHFLNQCEYLGEL